MTRYISKVFNIQKRRCKIFIRLSLRHKLLLIESFLLTGIARFLILFIPFRKVASLMGEPMKETPMEVDSNTLTQSKEVAWFVIKVSRFTPWESKCLVQALTCQFMLRIRGISSTIYLGIARGAHGNLLAHAWLRCGDAILTGDDVRSMYKQVSWYGFHSI